MLRSSQNWLAARKVRCPSASTARSAWFLFLKSSSRDTILNYYPAHKTQGPYIYINSSFREIVIIGYHRNDVKARSVTIRALFDGLRKQLYGTCDGIF